MRSIAAASPYASGFPALNVSPVVLQVPDFGTRFWVFQIADSRTDSFGSPGGMYGVSPGFYLLVGPDWEVDVLRGIAPVFRSSTNSGVVAPRISLDDRPEDKRDGSLVAGQGVQQSPRGGTQHRGSWRSALAADGLDWTRARGEHPA
jgi:hypothetical protein